MLTKAMFASVTLNFNCEAQNFRKQEIVFGGDCASRRYYKLTEYPSA
jgi:hypothetical protein